MVNFWYCYSLLGSVIFIISLYYGHVLGSEIEETMPEIEDVFVFRPLNHTLWNVNDTSPEFRKLASETYEKVLPCIRSTWMMVNKTVNFTFPEDAEQHYRDVLRATAPFDPSILIITPNIMVLG